jgi:hypothetical protein
LTVSAVFALQTLIGEFINSWANPEYETIKELLETLL